MHAARFEQSKISFPPICVRCGIANPSRTFQLALPYRAWWRSNPVVKSPVCTRCFLILGVEGWASLLLMLGAELAATYFVSTLGIVLIADIQRKFLHAVSQWLVSGWFVEMLFFTILVGAVWFFGIFRDRYLRRDHLKVSITDYQNDWVELSANDASYFEQLEHLSPIYS
jgi:hypothetical protein